MALLLICAPLAVFFTSTSEWNQACVSVITIRITPDCMPLRDGDES